jgi:formate-dependent nitrite reductase membrane component NrfD
VFCHSAWLQISPARFKQVYSDRSILCAINIHGNILGGKDKVRASLGALAGAAVLVVMASSLGLSYLVFLHPESRRSASGKLR